MTDCNFDIVVIGGGIVGLATALEVTRAFPRLRLLVVEKEHAVAQHQSGNNSGVIHSGIYYKPGSLKAKLCVEGAAGMINFCREHQIKHEVCGKIIVATETEELPRLQVLFERGQANGLSGVRQLNREQIKEIEPHCGGIRGLFVPQTGIADYPAVCEKYAELIAQGGGTVRTLTRVTRLVRDSRQIIIETTQGEFSTRYLINCAGLHSDRVSRMAGQGTDVKIIPFRGEYYDLIPERESLVRGLIYPVPDPRLPFLGVHFTRRAKGGVDAGPNAVWALKREGYRWTDISPRDLLETVRYPGFWRLARKHWRTGIGEVARSLSKKKFVQALQKLVPEIRSQDLKTGGSGVRAQAVRPDGSLLDDFHFIEQGNVLHVCNVPSPAATASLAIAGAIVRMAEGGLGLTRS
jgi:L-2-hydroxyglutarate oxidase